MLIYLVQGITFGFAAAMQPGPMQAYLVSQALDHGWRRALPVTFAPLISDGPIIALVLLVLTRMPEWLERVLQTAGGCYLLYLAYSTYVSWRLYDAKQAEPTRSRTFNVFKAALVNLLNPNPYLGWMLVMGPLLLEGWRIAPANGIALVLAFYCTMVAGAMGIVVLFSSARSLGPRVNRAMIGVSAIGLALLGLFQLWQGTLAHLWK
jgi:threonine/homoserine/homoserine lactone efflux protein